MMRPKSITKLLDKSMSVAWLMIGIYLNYEQWPEKDYSTEIIITLSCITLAIGHWKSMQWATQTSIFLMLISNIIAVFAFFPPFEGGPSSLNFSQRIILFAITSMVCTGASIGLYMTHRDSKR